MSTESDMIAAATAAETAAVQLAAAYVAYADAYRVAASAVHSSSPGPRASTATSELEAAVGAERVAQFVHARLIALGATRILEQPGRAPAGPEWVAYLTAKIQQHVP